MRVLHVLASNKFSGAENVVCQIIEMFEKDPDIEMAYCSPEGSIRTALQERNINFIAIESLSKKEIKRVIDEYKPDVVHAHDRSASYVVSKISREIPFISHVHNNFFDSRRISLKSLFYYFAAKKAKHIFWVSQSAFNSYAFHEKLKNKSSILYNVINIDSVLRKASLDKNNYDYDVVFVGRLTEQKNPHRLLSVVEKAVVRKHNLKVAVVGSGELEEEVKRICSEKGLDNNVTFLGFMENPLKIMQDSKVMIMTSRWEGTPICALEAMAVGLPIVSTPTDGLCDLIENGENGFLCDNDDELAEKLILLQDESFRQQMSEKQKTMGIDKNNTEVYKNKLLAVYTK